MTELPTVKEIFCAKDRATAMQLAGPYLFGKYKDYAKWGQDEGRHRFRYESDRHLDVGPLSGWLDAECDPARRGVLLKPRS